MNVPWRSRPLRSPGLALPARLAARPRLAALAFVAAMAILAALPFVFQARFFSEPFDRDEGVYATVARGLSHGQLPYRDLFDHKPPLIYGWYWLSFAAFGERVEAPRFTGALVLSATAILVAWCAAMLYGRRGAVIAGLVFAAAAANPFMEPGMNTEPFMLLPMAGSLAAALYGRQRGNRGLFVVSGVLLALAALTKTVALANGPVILAVIALENGRRVRWRYGIAFAGGGLAVAAATLVLAAAMGVLGDFLWANVGYNAVYARELSAGQQFTMLQNTAIAFVVSAFPVILVASAGAACAALRRTRADWIVLAWLAASFAGSAMGGHYFIHYLVQVLPALALAASAMAAGIPIRVSRTTGAGFALLLLVATGQSLAADLPVYLGATDADRMALKEGDDVARERAVESAEVAAWIAARTSPSDRIFEYGRESQVYFAAGRQPSARFFYDRPLWGSPANQAETLASLEAAPPVYFIDTTEGDKAWSEHPPELLAFLAQRYDDLGWVAFAHIYRLRQ